MLFDFLSISAEQVPSPDVIVIGAGAVGLVTALALEQRGFQVLVIESGGAEFEVRAQELNLAHSVGKNHDGLIHGRARGLGGTTTLWGGQLVPFSPIDFEIRPWIENSGWPLSYAEIAPFYDRVLQLLGSKNYSDNEIWAQVDAPNMLGSDDIGVFLTRWLREPNFRILFKRELSKRNGKLDCLLHATVTGLLWDAQAGLVYGIEVRSWGGRQMRINARKIVIAAGTVESARLMLHVANSDESVPWKNNKWVGAAFHDHLDCRTAKVKPIDVKRFSAQFDNIYLHGGKFQPKIGLSRASQEQEHLLNAAGSMIFESSLQETLDGIKHITRMLRRGVVPNFGKFNIRNVSVLTALVMRLTKRYLVSRRAFNLSDRGILLNVHCEQVPCWKSQIRLDLSKRDANDMPGVLLDWRIDGREIQTIAMFTEKTAHYLKSAGLATVEILDDIKNRDPSALSRARDSYHQGGGLRMADTKVDGVVDSNLRVFGTQNLYVAGAATFPTSGHANSTFTAMALGVRLAATLSQVN